uniref:Uncharacterized protein n=1 Tax=Timema bartmani TaxID=61472 RepID=A0A7R9F3S2_9NEOP|nr:unnamed protein product [Timema bartmani]
MLQSKRETSKPISKMGKKNVINRSLWLRQRENGQTLPIGHSDNFSKSLYSSIVPCTSWDHSNNLKNTMHGGVFNLEFSPDGSLLVAACEKKSVLMFDPLSRRLVHAVNNAHRDCVNCVRFLDSRVFATCSDDSTVALWDARNLKTRIRTLNGHSNWVKNIEFSPRDGLLVTSGFDGSIYTWDINRVKVSLVGSVGGLARLMCDRTFWLSEETASSTYFTESGFVYNRVFHTNGLMRTRLNSDASKMVICTIGGLPHHHPQPGPEHHGPRPGGVQGEPPRWPERHLEGSRALWHQLETLGGSRALWHQLETLGGSRALWNLLETLGGSRALWHQLETLGGSRALWHQCFSVISSIVYCESGALDHAATEAGHLVLSDTTEPDRHTTGIRLYSSLFQPNMYRLMQLSQTTIPVAAEYTHLFSNERRSNRVEFVTDFPQGDDAEVVSSLQIHPQGWCALSRNISNDENSEWTCVHDIQDCDPSQALSESVDVEEWTTASLRGTPSAAEDEEGSAAALRESRFSRLQPPTSSLVIGANSGRVVELPRIDSGIPTDGGATVRRGTVGHMNRRFSTDNMELHMSTTDVWEAVVGIREARVRRERERERAQADQSGHSRRFNENRIPGLVRVVVRRTVESTSSQPATPTATPQPTTLASDPPDERVGEETSHRYILISNQSPTLARHSLTASGLFHYRPRSDASRTNHIHQNIKRLSHYIEEPNVGKGFIKELCFSSDGRLICSPFGYGVRLLAFSSECAELSACVPAKPPMKLHELACNVSHRDIVVSTKFSPLHCMLVSGCLGGKIVWHQPVF